ncbi:thioesterase family protein [Sporothrix schenckii 1099-18]|uniref:Thioesterase family protein n=1 Tax=Sporothrix schenckii 1099-18 TaxID=1397361 RepID=A0A0F2M3V1_SPOSC|nr:thioesterase family protein [Sporothrix schenckii 1099-18]KJR83445.1 thioesterase family protein [Sporothrix schenckii 1099-18]
MAGSKMTNAERITKLLEMISGLESVGIKDFMSSFLPHLTLVSADDFETAASHHHPPRIVFGYSVQPEHCNRMYNMHGGATAALFDFCTSLALALAPSSPKEASSPQADAALAGDNNDDDNDEEELIKSWRRLGVSRTLNVTYVRPAPMGLAVLVECEQVHAGQRLSTLRGVLRRAQDGAVLATCEHGKVNMDPDNVPTPSKI